jgi:hypothetical protein
MNHEIADQARQRLLALIEQQALRVYEEAMKNPPVPRYAPQQGRIRGQD